MAKRVFFSFHYQDVIDFRVNIVRNHWITKSDRKEAGFFDASIWESAKRTSDLALKKLINKGLSNTSSTCVLIGTDTFQRRWVRYEILRSIFVSNSICGVHINKIKDKDQRIKNYGENPFDYLGIEYSEDGYYAQPIEYKNIKWHFSKDFEKYKLGTRAKNEYRGKSYKLSKWYSTYKWISDDGYNNFSKWV